MYDMPHATTQLDLHLRWRKLYPNLNNKLRSLLELRNFLLTSFQSTLPRRRGASLNDFLLNPIFLQVAYREPTYLKLHASSNKLSLL
jgi:hypothetical protein